MKELNDLKKIKPVFLTHFKSMFPFCAPWKDNNRKIEISSKKVNFPHRILNQSFKHKINIPVDARCYVLTVN